MTTIRHGDIFSSLETWAPKSLAYDWDNVGMQVGTKEDETKGVLVTLDVTEEVVDEAIMKGANVIIAHHPMIFRPLKNIDYESVKGRLIKKIIKHDLTVYASHTNLDVAQGGVNDLLSDALELSDVQPLIPTYTESLVKLVVFTPRDYVTQVVDALSNAGAGHIGNYSHCTFQSPGEGTFKPLEGTNPFIGQQGELEHVDEVKVETIVEESNLSEVIDQMSEAHPYEEVAYDIISLKNKGETLGIGRIGNLAKTMSLEALLNMVKDKYEVEHLRYVGDLEKPVKRVAVLGGSGEKFIDAAMKAKADVYITGDMTFHPAQDAANEGLAIVDPGHYIEKIMKEATKRYLKEEYPQLKVYTSQVKTEPFQFF